jgi:hypothetical protein
MSGKTYTSLSLSLSLSLISVGSRITKGRQSVLACRDRRKDSQAPSIGLNPSPAIVNSPYEGSLEEGKNTNNKSIFLQVKISRYLLMGLTHIHLSKVVQHFMDKSKTI